MLGREQKGLGISTIEAHSVRSVVLAKRKISMLVSCVVTPYRLVCKDGESVWDLWLSRRWRRRRRWWWWWWWWWCLPEDGEYISPKRRHPPTIPTRHQNPQDHHNENCMFIRNFGICLQVHTALQPRRATSMFSPPWEPHISCSKYLFSFRTSWKQIETAKHTCEDNIKVDLEELSCEGGADSSFSKVTGNGWDKSEHPLSSELKFTDRKRHEAWCLGFGASSRFNFYKHKFVKTK
jgi:hypothetical protein